MENKFIVSLSPHVHGGDSIQKNMYGVLIALFPAFIVSLLFFGLGALIVTATSVAACVFFEWAIGKYLLKKETTTICDGSAIITGVLLAFNLPSNLPIWIIILGALFAIGVGKMSFGGLGNNPFNPALAGRVFLLLSFPVQMTTWPVVGQLTAYADATTGATPLAIMKGVINGAPGVSLDQLPDALSLLIGQNGGCLGEVSAVALLLGLIYMLWKKIITWHIPVSILVTVFVFSGIMHLVNPALYVSPVLQLLTGGLMLGAIFMATDYVISALANANKNLVVINISGNAVAMPWVAEVPSVLQAWFLGSEAGSSIAAILMGDVNPSGRLPFTFPARLEDVPAHSVGEYFADRSKKVVDMKYNEGIFVGYRWTDKQKKVKPLFPFGHGLSYTTFVYSRPIADKKIISVNDEINFTVTVKNTGEREGHEVVQLYISDKKSSLPRPVKELKGFKKVKLAPGEEKDVTFTIDKEALSYFDDIQHTWVAEPGKFEAIIAASAADIKGVVPFELK